MKKYNQRTLKGTIGDTRILLSRYGCYISSICSGWSRIYPKGSLHPHEAARIWDFTKDGLLKYSTDFDGIEFCGKIKGEPSNDELAHWVRSKDRFMVLELNGGAHFVFVYYYPLSIGVNGTVVIDSLGGKVRPFWLTGYQCTGARLFKKKGSL